MFAWDTELDEYIRVGKSFESETTCLKHFRELVKKNLLPKSIDASRTELRYQIIKEERTPWMRVTHVSLSAPTDTKNKPDIYVDMDGTLAVFKRLSTMEDLLEEGYFRKLHPLINVVKAIKILCNSDKVNVHSLSAYLPESKYALSEKNEWLDEIIPEIPRDNRIFVPCGKNKSDFLENRSESDILLDDYWKNLSEWHGIPVKVFNGVNGTSDRGWNGFRINYESTPEEIAEYILQIAMEQKITQSPTR